MARTRQVQTSFSFGEIDPLMVARTDVKSYQGGCETLRNWKLLVQGGIRRRNGLKYRATLNQNGRLARFQFSTNQAYVLLFSPSKLEIYNPDGTLATTINSCPWTTSDMVWGLRWAQTGDTMVIVNQSFAPQILLRTGLTSFTLNALSWRTQAVSCQYTAANAIVDKQNVSVATIVSSGGTAVSGTNTYQPYFKFADGNITMTPSALSGSITLTLSSSYWVAGDVGKTVRFKGVQCLITGYTSGTVVTATAQYALPDLSTSANWDEPAFSSARGYPQAVCFHEQRLWLGGSTSIPNGLWGSKSGDFYNMDTGTALDSEAIALSLFSNELVTISHLVSFRHLQIYTDRGEFFIPVPLDSSPTTPKNVNIKKQTPYGASSIHPAVLDGATIFIQRTGRVCREFLYDYFQQNYDSHAVSLMSTHLLTAPVDLDVLYGTTDRPEQYAFIVQQDGSVAVYHSVRSEKLAGWVPWDTPNGLIQSVAVVADTVYFLVKRTLNNATVYTLETLDSALTLDCAKTLTSGSPQATWTGLSFYNGATVSVVSGNYYVGDFAVSGGSITLPDTYSTITVGYNYVPTGRTTTPVIQIGTSGSVIAEPRRISQVIAIVDTTLSLNIQGTELVIRQTSDDVSLEPTPLTRECRFYCLGYSRRPKVTFTQTVPLPLTILALSMEVAF